MTPIAPLAGANLSEEIIYPESDGKPLSDNTKQFRWINLLFVNLAILLRNRLDVFLAGDILWYPVQGVVTERLAPDVMVVFGRPRGDRGSYLQWKENGIPVTVAFEILSPNNTQEEMIAKQLFYDHHGVEEYYVYDPDGNTLEIYVRGLQTLRRVRDIQNFISPRLGIRFEMTSPEMTVYGPDGARFLLPEELRAQYDGEVLRANEEKQRADEEKQRAEEEKQRADEEKQRAEEENQRANAAMVRIKRLAELSRKARLGQTSPDELAELERLESESLPE